MGKVSGAPIGPLGRNGIGICAGSKQPDRGIQVCEVRSLARNPFFEVVNMAADFSAPEAKGGNDVAVGHAPNLGADQIHFLWQLRHNTGNFRYYGASATRTFWRPPPAFVAWSSLTLYPPFASSALKSAAIFATSKNGSRASGRASQIWMPRSGYLLPVQIPMPFRPSVLIDARGTLLTMSCPGSRKTLCEPHEGRLRQLK